MANSALPLTPVVTRAELEEALRGLEHSYFRVFVTTFPENGWLAGDVNVNHLVTLYLYARGGLSDQTAPDTIDDECNCTKTGGPCTPNKSNNQSFAGTGPDDAEFGSAEWRRDNPGQ